MFVRLLKLGVTMLVGLALAAPVATSAHATTEGAGARMASAGAAQAESAPRSTRAAKTAPRAGREPQVYLFRGLANVFSAGMDDMSRELRARGVPSEVLNHASWPQVAADIAARYKANPKRTRPIVLIGHSLGANAALIMSQQLVRNGVPVDLVVTFDPTASGPVGPGVRRYLNIYQSNNGWSSPLVVPPGAARRVVNSDVRARNDIKGPLTHFDIDKNRVLQKQVLSEVVRLTGGKARQTRAGTL